MNDEEKWKRTRKRTHTYRRTRQRIRKQIKRTLVRQHANARARNEAIRYDTLRYNTVQYDTLRYDAIRHDTIRCDTIRCEPMRYDTIRHDTIEDGQMFLWGASHRGSFFFGASRRRLKFQFFLGASCPTYLNFSIEPVRFFEMIIHRPLISKQPGHFPGSSAVVRVRDVRVLNWRGGRGHPPV